MRTGILKILKQHAPAPVSGEMLGKTLGISRTAVWKHIQALKKEGYQITAFTKKGYALLEVPDKMLPAEIEEKLHTKFVGRHIHYYESVASSNDTLKQLALEGAEDGTVVVAEEQTGGHGRLHRGWFSPKYQGIWFSVLFKPPFLPQEASKITLLSAVTVVRAIRECCHVDAKIKWPNDILLEGKKLVGILTEMNAEFGHINYLISGIGINVNVPKEIVPEELRSFAISIAQVAGHNIDRVALFAKVLDYMESYYEIACREGFDPVIQEWRKYSTTLGKDVKVIAPDKTYTGKAMDIDTSGCLVVQRDDTGELETVLAGDVSIRPVHGKGKYE